MNVGILGHVDAGKTTLARALSTFASTAAFDKGAKASNLRANTIDLGFSALELEAGKRIALIDCPGHAQLIKAVLVASSVFDGAIVVINAVRGIEPQTAEHLLLASILCPDHVIVVLSKTDLVEASKVETMKKRLPKLLKSLKISESSPIIALNLTQNAESPTTSSSSTVASTLLPILSNFFFEPNRQSSGQFILSVDHCFSIKGKGTVMTGTVVDGSCKIGTEVIIPDLGGERRKVKEVQSWKQVVSEVKMGERAALLFANLPNTEKIDRTIIFAPGALVKAQFLLLKLNRIEQCKFTFRSGSKIHVFIGFENTMAQCSFLKSEGDEFEIVDELTPDVKDEKRCTHVLVELQKPVYLKLAAMILAVKLDSQKPSECRFAFYGPIESLLESLDAVRRFRRKVRQGFVDRVESDSSLICAGLFKKETTLDVFNGMQVFIGDESQSATGRIEGAFGKSGKVRISLHGNALPECTKTVLAANQKVPVYLRMKKYLGAKGELAVDST